MSNIKIEWLSEYSDCDQAGCSGGYSEGARVTIDGKLVLDLTPSASCFGGDHYDTSEVYRRIFAHLGHTVEEDNA